MHSTAELAAAFAVDKNTLRNWIALGRLGRREGGARVFDRADSFAIGLAAALHHAGLPIGYTTIESAKLLAVSKDRPSTVRVRGNDVASVVIDLAAAEADILKKLGEQK